MRIGITGDTGFNIYTQYVKGYESADKRVQKPSGAFDVHVPSGASFISIILKRVLRDSLDDEIEHYLPKEALAAGPGSCFSTLVKFLVELEYYGGSPGHRSSVLRVARSRPIDDRDVPAEEDVFHHLVNANRGPANAAELDMLVIHDGAGSWRRYPRSSGRAVEPGCIDAMELVKRVLDRGSVSDKCPRVLVNLNYDLPDVVRSGCNRELSFPEELTFWRTLQDYKDQVCVMCSVNLLRREGAAVSRRISWEQTIEDLAADLFLFDKIKILSRFKHLIIRFGVVGAIHVMTDNGRRTADLVFAPRAKSGFYRDPLEDGTVDGQGVLLTAALVKRLAQSDDSMSRRRMFIDAMKTGILACMQAFDVGYNVFWKAGGERTPDAGEQIVRDLCDAVASTIVNGYSDDTKGGEEHTLGEAVVPCEILDRPPGITGQASRWEILRSAINPSVRADGNLAPTYVDDNSLSRVNIGTAIVLFGHEEVLNRVWTNDDSDEPIRRVLSRPPCVATPEETREYITLPLGSKPDLPTSPVSVNPWSDNLVSLHPIFAPVMTFNDLVVIERAEIESLRSIRNLVKGYLEKSSSRMSASSPISISVFGSPGTGKSFLVKQIAKDINRSLHEDHAGLEPIEYNVAQFRSVDDLGDAITRASVINNEGKTPLVFFDEFDCEFQGSSLGWLRYFLSPMQEGTFYGSKQTIKINRAIFVFAGGIHHSFDAFDPFSSPTQADSADAFEELERRQQMFREQKGPDFISRLRGHINVSPINARDGDVKPIIRRAIILRGLIEKRKLVATVRGHKVALIDEDVVYALLNVDRYRHGTRSMEAILEMCSTIEGRIEKASIPPRAQLNMHVDADVFFIRMYRGRFRSPVKASPKFKPVADAATAP